MPEDVKSSYLVARRSAKIATLAMSLIGALQFLIFAVYLFSLLRIEGGPDNTLRLAAMLSTVVSTALLASFFWHFGRDKSPFGHRQSIRLAFAAILFMARIAFDALVPALVPLMTVGNTPGLTEHPEVNLQIVTIIVFLGCLAMVMRYGEALKEDSDSIA